MGMSDGGDMSFVSTLTPEQLDAWVKQGSNNQRMQILNQQLAQAHALRGIDTNNHTTGTGGALGALAGMLNTYTAGKKEKYAEAAQQNALSQGDAATKSYLQSLIQALRGAQKPVPTASNGVDYAPAMSDERYG